MFKRYQRSDFNEIVFEIKNQRAIITQTDTIYGILSLNEPLLYKIKHRPAKKKIVRFVNNLDHLTNINPKVQRLIEQFWPGGLTIIVDGVSYRKPNDQWINDLVDVVGPIYCSSANLSDQTPIQTLAEADQAFDQRFFYDLILVEGGNPEPSHVPSTIVDCDHWTIIREGKDAEQIRAWIQEN